MLVVSFVLFPSGLSLHFLTGVGSGLVYQQSLVCLFVSLVCIVVCMWVGLNNVSFV